MLAGQPRKTLSLGAAELVALAAEVLARGGRFQFRVTGTSMRPGLVAGDLVVLAPLDPDSIIPGDVVLVSGPRPLLHRVVRIDRRAGRVVTRGDAAETEDPPAALGDVVGRVIGVQRPWPVSVRGWAGRIKRRLLRGLRNGGGQRR